MKYLDLRTVFLFKMKLVGDSLSARCSFKSFVFLVVMMLMTTSNLFADAGLIGGYFVRFALDPETKTATLRYVSLEDAHKVDFVIPETFTEDGITYLVVGLGDRCFEDCYALNSVTIPSSVTSLGDNCFSGCSKLTSVTIPSSVTSMGKGCFKSCDGLTSVTIPSSVTSLGEECFQSCDGLTSVTIPSSVTSLGDNCFSGCKSLPSVTIPSSVTSLGDYCFTGCSNLTYVTVPSSVTSMGHGCFQQCIRLVSVTLPSTITLLGIECFQYCISLRSIVIPSSVTSLGRSCFEDCINLTSVTLPSTITSMGERCLRDCRSLPSITLPSTVESIGNQCFVNCSLLKTVKFYGKLPHFTKKEYEENYELGLKKDCNIFVPEEYLQDYKNALGTDYMNIFAWNSTNINLEKVRGIMAFSHDGVVSITGLDSGEVVKFYTPDGKLVGTSVAADGAASCAISETLVIAKFGNHAIKIAVK